MKNSNKLIDEPSSKVQHIKTGTPTHDPPTGPQTPTEGSLKHMKSKIYNNFNRGISYTQQYGKSKENTNSSPRQVYFNSPRNSGTRAQDRNPLIKSHPNSKNMTLSENLKENYFSQNSKDPQPIFNNFIKSNNSLETRVSRSNNFTNETSLKTQPNTLFNNQNDGAMHSKREVKANSKTNLSQDTKNFIKKETSHGNLHHNQQKLIQQQLVLLDQKINLINMTKDKNGSNFALNNHGGSQQSLEKDVQTFQIVSRSNNASLDKNQLNDLSSKNSQFRKEEVDQFLIQQIETHQEIQEQMKKQIQNRYKNSLRMESSFENTQSAKGQSDSTTMKSQTGSTQIPSKIDLDNLIQNANFSEQVSSSNYSPDYSVSSPFNFIKKQVSNFFNINNGIQVQMENGYQQDQNYNNDSSNNNNINIIINSNDHINISNQKNNSQKIKTQINQQNKLNSATQSQLNLHELSYSHPKEIVLSSQTTKQTTQGIQSLSNNAPMEPVRRYSENHIQNITDIGKNELYKELEQKVNEIQHKLDQIQQNISEDDSSLSFHNSIILDEQSRESRQTSLTAQTPLNISQASKKSNQQFFFIEKSSIRKKQNMNQAGGTNSNSNSLRQSQLMTMIATNEEESGHKENEIQKSGNSFKVEKEHHSGSKQSNQIQMAPSSFNQSTGIGSTHLEGKPNLSDFITQVQQKIQLPSQSSQHYSDNSNSYLTIHQKIQQLHQQNQLFNQIDQEYLLVKQIQAESDEILAESQKKLKLKSQEINFIDEGQKLIKESSQCKLQTQAQTIIFQFFKDNQQVYFVSAIINAHISQDFEDPFVTLCRQHLFQCMQSLKFIQTLKLPTQSQIEEQIVYLPMAKQKTLVFDLDETLIHCNDKPNSQSDVYLPIKFAGGEIISAGINIRPYVHEALQELNQYYEIIIFTASHSCYANIVLDYLDPQGKYFRHRFFRESCIPTDQGIFIKDLRVIGNRDLKDMVLVDNAAYSFGFQINNGVPIIPYYDNKRDTQLLSLVQYLQTIVEFQDLREANQMTFQMSHYTEFGEQLDLLEKVYFQNN